MDDCGILGCSETEYFSCNQTNSNDRRLMGSFRSIFRLDDPNIPTCFTDISPVGTNSSSFVLIHYFKENNRLK